VTLPFILVRAVRYAAVWHLCLHQTGRSAMQQSRVKFISVIEYIGIMLYIVSISLHSMFCTSSQNFGKDAKSVQLQYRYTGNQQANSVYENFGHTYTDTHR